jgi:hypothetical protein
MEFCNETLKEIIDSKSLLGDKDEIMRIFRQILEGLAYMVINIL